MNTIAAERRVRINASEGSFELFVPDGDQDRKLKSYRSGHLPESVTPLLRVLQRTTKPGGRVLDFGGYIGGFGLAAAAAGYAVVIVEGNPVNAERIQRSAQANQFRHPVVVVNGAVGEKRGQITFSSHGPWGHVSSERSSDEVTDTVPLFTLPDVLEIARWDTPDFIKLDIEGSEVAALKGGSSWFAQGHRPVVLYEANAFTLSWFEQSVDSLNSIFDALGYTRYEMDDSGLLRIPNSFEPRVLVDYLAVPRPISDVLPALSAWKVFKRTVRALRHPSAVGRQHTRTVMMNKILGR